MWITALLMGFVGSLHCLGMCSPLVMVVTYRQPFPVARLLYNFGRIGSYAVLGFIAASFGSLFNFSGWQQTMSVILGIVLIIIGVTGASQLRIPFLTKGIHQFSLLVRNRFSDFLQKKSVLAMFVLGALNGLLPCGLIYIAIAYCVSLPPIDGIFFMCVFGVATLPVMFGVPSLFASFIQKIKISFKRVTAIVLILTGVLLLGRTFFMSNHLHTPVTHDDQITVCK